MLTIARHCDSCKVYQIVEAIDQKPLQCPQCQKTWGTFNKDKTFENCPVCTGRQFYVSKDFNQALGCLIMAVGIVLVPWTFGLSLPVFALIDWIIYKKIPTIVCCYRCGSEFRGFEAPKILKPFMHHIGLKYDKYRS